ncbi:MAG: hypothetical protein QW478_04665, partial [Candidatus Micrarchaeaceae archaeon]
WIDEAVENCVWCKQMLVEKNKHPDYVLYGYSAENAFYRLADKFDHKGSSVKHIILVKEKLSENDKTLLTKGLENGENLIGEKMVYIYMTRR